MTQVTQLTLEYATSVEVVAHPGAKLTFLESEGDWAWVLALSFDTSVPQAERSNDPSDTWNAPVLARLPRQVLSSVEVPLREPAIQNNPRDFDRYVYGTSESTGIGLKLRCGPIQILADLPGGVQQLRQIYEGIEVRGFTREPIEWNWGTYTCWPRVTRFTTLPWHRETLPSIPAGQIPVDLREARKAAQLIQHVLLIALRAAGTMPAQRGCTT